MLPLNLFDSNFVGQMCSVAGAIPETMRYVRDQMDWSGITLFTDGQMFTREAALQRSRYKIGWLHEGRELHPENYARIQDVRGRFDAALTTDPDLLAVDPAFFLKAVRGGCWIPQLNWGLRAKHPRAAMIVSDKHQTSGHVLRWQTVAIAAPIRTLWLYGDSFEEIGTNKKAAYASASHAVVIEAERSDNFFSEHLLDAMVLGCIPIYWGCPNIGEYFDVRGLIICETLADIRDAIRDLPLIDPEILAANIARAADYAITEDWLVRGPLRPFIEGIQITEPERKVQI